MDWPKCKKCGGLKTVPALVGNDAGAIGEMDCLACNGTGERDLTADEAAEYIKPYFQSMICINRRFEIAIWIVTHTELSSDRSLHRFSDEILTVALNAAARAVKERGKECPTTKK